MNSTYEYAQEKRYSRGADGIREGDAFGLPVVVDDARAEHLLGEPPGLGTKHLRRGDHGRDGESCGRGRAGSRHRVSSAVG